VEAGDGSLTMRVHIFDQQLNLVSGHYSVYDAAVSAELRRRGIETLLYGTAHTPASAASRVDAVPVFSRGMFDEVANDPLTWPLENFVRLGREFHADLAKLGSGRFARGDVAFFPNIIQSQIGGVRDWIMSLPPERRPAVVLKPSYLTYAMPYIQRRSNKEIIPLLYRFSIRQLVADHSRTWICSDTEEMVNQFATISGVPVHLVPLPLIMERRAEKAKDPSRIEAVYLGHASMLKGFHLLADVVKRVQADGNALHFLIQSYGEPQLCAAVEKALAALTPDRVTVIAGAVDAEAYGALLNRADIVLLPYVREFYGWASSGIFSEAVSLGKVTVVTERTWPARQLEKFGGGGVTFASVDVESVAAAIGRAMRELPQLTERASRAAPVWRRHHCPASFVDQLLALVGSHAA
jgi:glycosyltransferase involved in cell wall biosynthesis